MAGSVHNLFLAVDPRPVSGQESARLLRLIRASFAPSYGIYRAPCVFLDLRKVEETCSKHRVTV